MLLLQPETYFTQIVLKSGLFVILVYVTCLAGESGSTEVQAVHLKVESTHRICDHAYRMYLRVCIIQDVILNGAAPCRRGDVIVGA